MAVGNDTLTIDRLDYRFVTYSEGKLVPLTAPENSEVAGLFINCLENQLLEFCGIQPFTIWIDGRFVAENRGDDCIHLSTDSLCSVAEREDPFLSIVSNSSFSDITARIFQPKPGKEKSEKTLSFRNNQNTYWIFSFLLGCIILAAIRLIRPKNEWRLQLPNLREFSKRFITMENIVFLVLLTAINAFCYSYILGKEELIFTLQSIAAILLFWLGRTFFIFLSGSIFKQWRWANWQLHMYLFLWSIFSLLLFIFLFINFIFFRESDPSSEMALLAGSIVSIIILLVVSAVLMTQKGHKNLHIFIYLCTTEILPTVLLVNWFLE